jgi:hypothetical protein
MLRPGTAPAGDSYLRVMIYPGEVKITDLREVRAIEYAR